MNKGIAHIWNQHVKQGDVIYHLGDFSFKPFSKTKEITDLTKSLNGFKILVLGNHDYKEITPTFGVDISVPFAYLKLGNVDFKLNHSPYLDGMTENDKENRPECFTNLEYNKRTKEPYPLICGHVHDEWATKAGCLNVGWDIWHKPLSEEDIIKIYYYTNGFKEYHKTKEFFKGLI